MDRNEANRKIVELFIRMVNKYNSLEKIPVRVSAKHDLYHSERHMLINIGEHPEMNVTEFANYTGVTKGAISQVLAKLEKKGFVKRYKKSTNDKEVYIELTKSGRDTYKDRKVLNEQSLTPLLQELDKHPSDKIAFLISMFEWIDGYFTLSMKRMREHARKKTH